MNFFYIANSRYFRFAFIFLQKGILFMMKFLTPIFTAYRFSAVNLIIIRFLCGNKFTSCAPFYLFDSVPSLLKSSTLTLRPAINFTRPVSDFQSVFFLFLSLLSLSLFIYIFYMIKCFAIKNSNRCFLLFSAFIISQIY